MKDKKRGFWILLIFFGILAIAGLSINQQETENGMSDMGLSMGGMMKMHHTDQLSPGDLLKPIIESHGMESMQGHHQLTPLMQSFAFLTTMTVFLFLPLIVGGTVTLLILWI